MKPLQDRVLIKPIKKKDKTESGIIIPDSAKDGPEKGEVVAVGIGRNDDQQTPLEEGQTVLYKQHAGTNVTIDSEKFVILKDQHVLGIV